MDVIERSVSCYITAIGNSEHAWFGRQNLGPIRDSNRFWPQFGSCATCSRAAPDSDATQERSSQVRLSHDPVLSHCHSIETRGHPPSATHRC